MPINGSFTIPLGYTLGGIVTQNITTKTSQTYNPSTTQQVINGGQYLIGSQNIAPVTGNATINDVVSGKVFSSENGINLVGQATISSLGGLQIVSGTIPMASVNYNGANSAINLSGYVNFVPKVLHGSSPFYGGGDPSWVYVITSSNSYTYICYTSGGTLKRTDISSAFSLSSIIIETSNNAPDRDVVWTAIG
jgi:hypothetical protein